MSLLTIAADFPDMERVLAAVEKASQGKNLRFTRDAVRAATTDLVQRTWIQYASGMKVYYSGGTFTINVVTGSYVRSIQDGIRFLDDLTGEVFSTSYHGKLIEEGQPPRDMKPQMLASPKAKTGKDGKKYVTVPFRHGTPGATTIPNMPKSVYSQAKNLGYSRRNGGLDTKRYTWGGRLGESPIGQRSHTGNHPGAGYTWRTGQYSGMVRVGQPGHSQYLSFRRLSENSDPKAWQFPGVKPKKIREAVVENTREETLQLVRRGFEMDLYFMGLGDGP